MSPTPSFLSAADRGEFAKPNRFVLRHVVQQFPEEGGQPVPVVQHVLARTASHVKKGGNWFEGLAISVQPDDGMTWTAESVVRGLLERHPTLRCWLVSDRKSTHGLPVVAAYLGVDRFLALAAKHGLTEPFLSWRSPQTVAVAIGAIALGIASRFLVDVKFDPSLGTLAHVITAPPTLLLAILSATVGLSMLVLHARLTSRTFPNALKVFLDRLSQAEPTDSFEAFVADLSRALGGGPFPRLVIVDNFDTLDSTTQRVIDRYLTDAPAFQRGSETWVVLEEQGRAHFSKRVLQHRRPDDPHGWGYRGTSVFAQEFLSANERVELLRALGRDTSEAIGLVTAKLLCKGMAEGAARVLAIAADHRKVYARTAACTALDILYLLSLTNPRHVFDVEQFLSETTSEQALRNRLLLSVLGTARITKSDLRRHIDALPVAFESFARLDRANRAPILQISPEVRVGLEGHAGELSLPDSSLVHAFWALYWYDRLLNQRPTNAFDTQVLAEHVGRAGLGALPERDSQLAKQATEQLFEASLFAARASLSSGVFTSVSRVLTQCSDILSSSFAEDFRRRRRFVELAWEAYSVLGDDSLLSLLLEHGTRSSGESVAVDGGSPIDLFVESLSLPQRTRPRVRAAVLERSLDSKIATGSIADYGGVRSAWLALTAAPFTATIPHSSLRLSAATVNVAVLVRTAIDRLMSAGAAHRSLMDMMTVSIGLWSLALRCSSRWLRASDFDPVHSPNVNLVVSLFGAPRELDSDRPVDGRQVLVGAPVLDELIDLAESAALLAREIVTHDYSRMIDTDFLREGLTREIGVIALTSASCGWLIVRGDHPHANLDRYVKRIADIAAVVQETLADYPLCTIKSATSLESKELFRQLDSLMRMCGLIWQKTGVAQLASFMAIRRLSFNTICARPTSNRSRPSPLLEMVSVLSKQLDCTGLTANLEMARYLESISELSAHYVDQAARNVIKGELGSTLRVEMALVALLSNQTFEFDAGLLVEALLDDETAPISRAFDGSAEDQVPGLVLAFYNISNKVSEPGLAVRLMEQAKQLEQGIESPQVREEIRRLHEYRSIRRRVDTIAPEAIGPLLDDWRTSRHLWPYAGLLNTLISGGPEHSGVVDEAERVLDRDPEGDTFNSYFLLAISVARRLLLEDRADESAAVRYLVRSLDQWSSQVTVETNLAVYNLLVKLQGPEVDRYQLERARWQQIKIENDHLRRLPQLADRKEFFLLFHEYFDLMASWGISLDMADSEYYARLRCGEAKRRAELERWDAPMCARIEPVRVLNGKPTVSVDFLCIGSYLYSASIDGEAAFDERRRIINARAKHYLPLLLDAIRCMPDVPPFIAQVFNHHSRRLEERLAA